MNLKCSRERSVEVRWIGGDATTKAVYGVLGCDPGAPDNWGECEQWMQIPVRLADAARAAIETAGGQMVESK